MNEWLDMISKGGQSPAALLASFILGLLGVITSCCTLPIFTAILAYSGSISNSKRRLPILTASAAFLLGTLLSLGIIGSVASLFSGFLANNMGYYWKIVAGLLFIFFGLNTLNLLPFRFGHFNNKVTNKDGSFISSLLFGLGIAGATTACNSLCNPAFTLIIGSAFLQGSILWAALLLLFFGLGYGLPMAVTMAGIGLGLNQLTSRTAVITKYIQYLAGMLLLGIGFYFLFSA